MSDLVSLPGLLFEMSSSYDGAGAQLGSTPCTMIFVTFQLPHLLSVDPHDPVQLAAVRHHEPQEVVEVTEDVKACE